MAGVGTDIPSEPAGPAAPAGPAGPRSPAADAGAKVGAGAAVAAGSNSRGNGGRQLRGCARDGSSRQRRGGVRGWAPGGCLGSRDGRCGGRWRRGFTRGDKGWRCRWNRRSVFRAAAASQQEHRQRHHCECCPGQAVHTHAFTPNPVNSPSQASAPVRGHKIICAPEPIRSAPGGDFSGCATRLGKHCHRNQQDDCKVAFISP